MNALRETVEDYLAMRRGLGFKLEGLAKLLHSFVTFCEDHDVDHVTEETAMAWATSAIKVPGHPALYARRLDAVRVFARHQAALDPATQIPPEDVLNGRYRPHRPRLFTEFEIHALLEATSLLESRFQAVTWRTLIGLLAATGTRPGEARRLELQDLNLADGLLRITKSKFDKSRLVFLHPSTSIAISDYLDHRSHWSSTSSRSCTTVFMNTKGTPISSATAGLVFRQLLGAAKITVTADEPPPRLHDLRHTFAVNTMLDWYRDGGNVQARLPLLSTWLGHIDPASTYWYLQVVPELLALATIRLESASPEPGSTP